MHRLSILYIGRDAGTSRHRALALQRMGHNLFIADPFAFLPVNRLAGLWAWKKRRPLLGRLHSEAGAGKRPRQAVSMSPWSTGGELVGPSLIADLKNGFGPLVNYNNDDPFGGRDGRRSRLYLRALPSYDLVVVVRDCNVPEALVQGARNVLRVFMSADELAHAARQISQRDREKWASEVLFVGTWMPERGPFMARLIELGVPLSIYGNRWSRAWEWQVLRPFWRGPSLGGGG